MRRILWWRYPGKGASRAQGFTDCVGHEQMEWGVNMVRIAIVGCTGKLGSAMIKNILSREDVKLSHAIARKGNPFVGKKVSELISCNDATVVIDEIESATDCDVFIDCTNTEAFMNNNYEKYQKMNKPVVIATTGFSDEDKEKIAILAKKIPILISGNFSVALYHFLKTIEFAAKRIDDDTDIQIVEYHHNQKKDAPSGTAIMIQNALVNANDKLTPEKINIHSVRGGNIFGEHEVIFANSKDEVITFKHQVSSREAFAKGAIDIAIWIVNQVNGVYNMMHFCGDNQ